MGIFDKLKQAADALTGGAAEVTVEWAPDPVIPGQAFEVKVVAKSTGRAVKSDGVFVDFLGHKTVVVPVEESAPEDTMKGDASDEPAELSEDAAGDVEDDGDLDRPALNTEIIFHESFRLCDAFVLGANETKAVEGQVTLPAGLAASSGQELGHSYGIRGRLEAAGNDPDSGYKPLNVGSA
ncbi:MAG: hypothetical protein JXR37_21970 [Kiritimatiellae bacterium]|nr:hypothetical protein [Kiritimatiellia bacterium]